MSSRLSRLALLSITTLIVVGGVHLAALRGAVSTASRRPARRR